MLLLKTSFGTQVPQEQNNSAGLQVLHDYAIQQPLWIPLILQVRL